MYRNLRRTNNAESTCGRPGAGTSGAPTLRLQRTQDSYEDPQSNNNCNFEKSKSCLKPNTTNKTISFNDSVKGARVIKKRPEEELIGEKFDCPCCRLAMEKIECISTQLREMQATLDCRCQQQEETEIRLLDMLEEILCLKRNPGGTESQLRFKTLSDYTPDLVAIEKRAKSANRHSRNPIRQHHIEVDANCEQAVDPRSLAACRDVSYPTRLIQYNIEARGSPPRIPSATYISAKNFLAGIKSMTNVNQNELRPYLLNYVAEENKKNRRGSAFP